MTQPGAPSSGNQMPIFAKTGVRDRAQAVVYAYENGVATSTRER